MTEALSEAYPTLRKIAEGRVVYTDPHSTSGFDEALHSEVRALLAENERLREDVDRLESQRASMETLACTAEQEMRQAEARVAELEAEVARLRAGILSLRAAHHEGRPEDWEAAVREIEEGTPA